MDKREIELQMLKLDKISGVSWEIKYTGIMLLQWRNSMFRRTTFRCLWITLMSRDKQKHALMYYKRQPPTIIGMVMETCHCLNPGSVWHDFRCSTNITQKDMCWSKADGQMNRFLQDLEIFGRKNGQTWQKLSAQSHKWSGGRKTGIGRSERAKRHSLYLDDDPDYEKIMNNARRKITIRRGSAMPCIVPKPANGRPCALDGSTIDEKRLNSSCWSNTTTTQPPQIIHDSSATLASNTLHSSHMSESIQQVEHHWKSRSEISYKIGMKIMTLPELWHLHDILLDSEKDRWLIHTHSPEASENKTSKNWAKHIEDYKAGTEDRLVHNFDFNKDVGSVNYQIHQTAVVMRHQPTKVTRTTSIMEPSLIEPTNVTNCPKQLHQPQHNHGPTDHVLKQINHGKVIGNTMAGVIHKTCVTHQSTTTGGGYIDTEGSFTGDRWTQLTLQGERHVSHHIYSKQFVSFSQLWILCFPAWANLPENLSLHL